MSTSTTPTPPLGADLERRVLTLDELAAIRSPAAAQRALLHRLAAPDPTRHTPETRARGVRGRAAHPVRPTHRFRRFAMKTSLTGSLTLLAVLSTVAGVAALSHAAPAPAPPAAPAPIASPLGGTRLFSGDVQAYSSSGTTVVLLGGERTRILMSGDGDTDLDLYVYDEIGRLVASDVGISDQASISITPRWTGEFRIVIRNLGSVYNHVELVVE